MDFLLRLRALRSHRRAESDLDEELQFHLEMEALKMRNSGQSEQEARQSARAHFGGVDLAGEECRDARGLTPLENLGRDLRYGLRMLRKTPVFTVVAVLSLAIGIGANTAVFSLVDAVLLKMLPVKNPEQLVVLKWGAKKAPDVTHNFSSGGTDSRGRRTRNTFSWQIFDRLRSQSRTVHSVIGFYPLARLTVATGRQALVTGGQAVSGNYFTGLGAGMAIGRPFTADDETAAGAPAAVISYRFWDRVYGLDPAVIGKTITLNTVPCVIVGVTQKGFFGVSPGGFILTPDVDISIPIRHRNLGHGRHDPFAPDQFWVQMMARRRPGMGDAAIETELASVVASGYPEEFRAQAASDPPFGYAEPGSQGLSSLREQYRNPLLIVMSVVGLTLLMACANLAGLLLARAAARRKEIMVRLALGAKRARLVRQLLVEGALLSGAGAAAGLFVAYAGVRGLLALTASGNSPVSLEVTPDARVLGFAIAVSLITTFLFALAPAMRATRVDVAQGLKQDTPSAGSSRFGAIRILVAAQVGVAMLLVTGAILLEQTLVKLRSVPLGFNGSNLALFDIAPGGAGYDEPKAMQLYARIVERLRQTPGVTGATLSAERLVSGWMSNGGVRVDGVPKRAGSTFNFVGPDFLEVMQIPLVAGRGILPRDMAATPRAAVVNETFVSRYLEGASPIGRRFRWDSKREWDVEIVGVARDARYDRLRGELPATIYAPYTQRPFGWPGKLSVEVRIAGDPAAATAAIRRTMSEIDRTLPLMEFKTQQAQIDDLLVQERLFAWLVSLFGTITLSLACVGIYGLVAASVAARTREIGVRIALGAGRGAVLRMLFGQVGLIAGAGLAIGAGAAWALTRVLESQLFEVKPHDPGTFVLAGAAVLLVSLGAAFLPARRAMRIDPVRALRYE